jgi:hypothetical protein
MRKTMAMVAVAAAVVLGACADGQDPVGVDAAADPAFNLGPGSRGTVYTMTNDAAGNAVLAFDRSAGGTLTPGGHVFDRGSRDPCGSGQPERSGAQRRRPLAVRGERGQR